jgi:Fuc2NAc and GlcNAc transferase
MNWFLFPLLSLGLGAAGAWSVLKFGGSYGLMDLPGDRSSHQRPTPKGGGIGILFAFVIVSLLNDIPSTLWLSAVLMSLTGLFDDLFELSKSRRLLVHFICALIVLIAGGSGETLDMHPLLGVVIGAFFIVGTANFFNFMDGINGIAGIMAIVGFGLLAIHGAMQGGLPANVILLGLCIVCACIGFLPFNIPKARVFMGDAGSILIGFLFAAIVWRTNKALIDIISCAAFFFLIYADAATTFLIRYMDGDPILVAHRRHLYQVLVNEMGFPHWKVSLGYGVVQILIGTVVIGLQNFGMAALCAGLIMMGLLFIAVSMILHRKADRVPPRVS